MSSQRSQTSCGITPTRMSAGEDRAAQAEPEDGLQRRGHDDEPEHDVRGADRADAEREHRGGDRQRRADALGEALRRAGHELLRQAERRRDDARDELADGAERRAGQHAREEPVGDDGGHPRQVEHDRRQAQQDDDAGDQARGDLVDGVREGEEALAHDGESVSGISSLAPVGPPRRVGSAADVHGHPPPPLRRLHRRRDDRPPRRAAVRLPRPERLRGPQGFADNAAETLQDSAVRAQISQRRHAARSSRPTRRPSRSSPCSTRSSTRSCARRRRRRSCARPRSRRTTPSSRRRRAASSSTSRTSASSRFEFAKTQNPGIANELSRAARDRAEDRRPLADRARRARWRTPSARSRSSCRCAAILLFGVGLFIVPDRRRAAHRRRQRAVRSSACCCSPRT